jgi:hypothetical protein
MIRTPSSLLRGIRCALSRRRRERREAGGGLIWECMAKQMKIMPSCRGYWTPRLASSRKIRARLDIRERISERRSGKADSYPFAPSFARTVNEANEVLEADLGRDSTLIHLDPEDFWKAVQEGLGNMGCGERDKRIVTLLAKLLPPFSTRSKISK